jgi:hypothetical protein
MYGTTLLDVKQTNMSVAFLDTDTYFFMLHQHTASLDGVFCLPISDPAKEASERQARLDFPFLIFFSPVSPSWLGRLQKL